MYIPVKMSLIEKQFENKSLNLTIISYIDNKQNVYFKGKDIALALGYMDTDQAIRTHVDDYDKKTIPSGSATGSGQTSDFH